MDVRRYAIATVAVLAIWLLGAWVTKYSLGQMALLAPIAVVFVGATAALLILWAKILRDSFRRRR